MDLGIRGRKAIVNGGSAGLGRGSALALAREGVTLFICARGEDRLLRTCEDIARQTGAAVTPIVADHGTAEGRARILAACPDPDIVVGTCSPPPFTDDYRSITEAMWRETLDTGLLGPMQFIREVLDGMVERRWGRIVNIAAVATKFPSELRVLSGAPRAALVNYSVAVSKAVAKHNVTVNTLLPLMHETDGIRAIYEARAAARGLTYEDEVRHAIETFPIPMGRFGDPEDFGAVVAFFCSQLANYVTGQSLAVEGGVCSSMF